jgi:hypothetical protein
VSIFGIPDRGGKCIDDLQVEQSVFGEFIANIYRIPDKGE